MKNTTHPTQPASKGRETVNYVAADGLVTVTTKTATARRYPQHNYPVVCLRFRPRAGSRVQQLPDGSCEVLMTHEEVAAHLASLNTADPKGGYRWRHVPSKSPARKAYWQRVNANRR